VKRTTWGRLIGGVILTAALVPAARAADEPKPEPKPETTVDASDPTKGFVTVKSGDNSLTFGAWGQFRAVIDDRDEYDNDTSGSGVGRADGVTTGFAVARLRPYVQGTVFKPWLRYKFEFELGPFKTDATNNTTNARITDAYVEFAKFPAATLRVGQYKVPFGLQQLTSDWKQEFVERSIVDFKFSVGRDIGLMLHGNAWEKKFGYQVGVFSGAGQNNVQEDQQMLYAARVWVDPLGEYKLFESANDASGKHIVHVGLAYRGGEVTKGTATAGVFENPNNETAWDLEAAWRWKRLFAMGEFFSQTDTQSNPTAAANVDAQGWHAQFGVMVQPLHHELALRYAEVQPDKNVSDAKQTEARLVYGYYIKGHNLKLQADIGEVGYGANFASLSPLALRNVSPSYDQTKRLVPEPGTALTDKQARIQLTLAF
jgi:phosphate-selective porin OprO/OprP